MIIIICGPAGAGKTSLASRLHTRLASRGLDFRILDSDQFDRNTYERMYEIVDGSDEDWILSGTFYKRKWQEEFNSLQGVIIVYLEASLETCLERNRQRTDPISEKAIHIIWKEFSEPDADIRVDVNQGPIAENVDHAIRELEALWKSSDYPELN